MPKVKANNLLMNYDHQGTGEPLLLLPFLSADQACYAFQIAEYSKHFTCFSLDLRALAKRTRQKAVTRRRILPTMRLLSWRPSACASRTLPACL